MSIFGNRTKAAAPDASPPATLGELEQRLETLHQLSLSQRAELDAIEAEYDLLERQAKGASLVGASVARHARLKEALPIARQALKATGAALEQTRKDIEAEHAAARRRPMTESERACYDCAAAYVAAVTETVQAAADFAAKARLAHARGQALGAAIGSDHARRMFDLGNWRVRLTAGVVRLFERDPDAAGVWGLHGALLELGDAKRSAAIARRGFLDSERDTVRDLLPSNIGDAL